MAAPSKHDLDGSEVLAVVLVFGLAAWFLSHQLRPGAKDIEYGSDLDQTEIIEYSEDNPDTTETFGDRASDAEELQTASSFEPAHALMALSGMNCGWVISHMSPEENALWYETLRAEGLGIRSGIFEDVLYLGIPSACNPMDSTAAWMLEDLTGFKPNYVTRF